MVDVTVVSVQTDGVNVAARMEGLAEAAHRSALGLVSLGAWAAYFGDHALALRLLGDSIARLETRVWYLWLPLFDETRRQPGFEDLIRDLELVDYWREYGWPEFCRPLGESDFECR
jgi:hypothetical protein